MTPLEIIRRAQAETLIDEDGRVVTLELLPGLSETELDDFARRLPCAIPPEISELLGACRGFYGTIEEVDFTGGICCSSSNRHFHSACRSRETASAISGS